MKAKFINQYEIKKFNEKYVIVDGRIYTNPLENPNKPLDMLGYKDLIETEPPIVEEENKYASPYYEETETQIIQKWEVKEFEVEEL